MITRQSIERVLETAKVDEVISDYVELRQRGVNKIGLCPFHDEKTPSFTVSPAKNIYKCFGCGKGGNAVQFLMEHESFSFPEAIRFLADKYNIILEETERTPEAIEEEKQRDSLYIINDYAKGFFVEQLLNTDEGRRIGLSYFKERGYLRKTIDDFELGYLSKDGGAFYTFAKRKGLNMKLVKDLGLITRNDRDMYRHRMIFPIHNLSGKILGFGARQLIKDKKSPKYLNSPESDIYNKRKVLYGLYQAKKSIIKEDICYLVEGYTDVLTLHQAGFENTVSSSGTALTKEQIQLIKRYTKNICLIFDGDQAGLKAARRALNLVLEQGLNLKILSLPDNHDPDTFIRNNGVQEFKTVVENESKDFIVKLLEWNYSKALDPSQKAESTKEILESVSYIYDPLKRVYYIQELAQTIGLDENVLVKEVNKIIYSRLKKEDPQSASTQKVVDKKERTQEPSNLDTTPSINKGDFLDRELCKLLVKYGDKEIDWNDKTTYVSFVILEELRPLLSSIRVGMYKDIIDIAERLFEQSEACGFKTFAHHEKPGIVQMAIELAHEPYELSPNWENKYDYPLQSQRPPDENIANVLIQVLLRYKLRAIQKLIDENKHKLKEVGSNEDMLYLLKVHQKLETEKSNVAKALNAVVI